MKTTWIDIHSEADNLIRHLRRLQRQIGPNTREATLEVLEHINEKAMENLDNNLDWGHSEEHPGERIENTREIKAERIGKDYLGSLTYHSKHAVLQEVGGYYIHERDPSEGIMPIGKEQGNIVAVGYRIEGDIRGKYYLMQALMSESENVHRIYDRYLAMSLI